MPASFMACCPNAACGKSGPVPPRYRGQMVRCPVCGQKFRVPADKSETETEDLVKQTTDWQPVFEAAQWWREASIVPGAAPEEVPPSALTAEAPQRLGHFEIRAVLGSGNFGTVYRAYDLQLEREVALKVPRVAQVQGAYQIERFLREGRSAARLQHPGIVPVYEAGSDGEQHYIAAALVKGKNLAALCKGSPLHVQRAARLVRELAEALAYAHRLGIVHRDVKPANVIVDEDDHPHLTDFGLAYRQESTTRLTRLGMLLGTPAYIAPEQAAGADEEPKAASDQYSLGVVLYELLCGRRPFIGTMHEILADVTAIPPEPPRKLNPAIPPELERICLRTLAKKPADRYPTCQELADDLRRWNDSVRVSAPQPESVEEPAPAPQRRPVLLWVGGSVACVAVGIALAFALRPSSPEHRPSRPDPGPVASVSPQPEPKVEPEKKPEPDRKPEPDKKLQPEPERKPEPDPVPAEDLSGLTQLAQFQALMQQTQVALQDAAQQGRLALCKALLLDGDRELAKKHLDPARKAFEAALKLEQDLVAERVLLRKDCQAEDKLKVVALALRQQECDDLVKNGRAALQHDRHEQAIDLANKALTLPGVDTKKPLALLKDASSAAVKAAFRQRDYDAVLRLAEGVLARDKADLEAGKWKVDARNQKRNDEQTAQQLWLKAQDFMKLNLPEDALELYKTRAQLLPKDPDAQKYVTDVTAQVAAANAKYDGLIAQARALRTDKTKLLLAAQKYQEVADAAPSVAKRTNALLGKRECETQAKMK